MHPFTDNAGRTWELAINVTQIGRVRSLNGVDLYSLTDDDSALVGILSDPCKLVAVLYVLCKAQAEEKHVSEEQFGEGLAGGTLEAAGEAFVREVIFFIPNQKIREAKLRVFEAAKRATDTAAAKAEAAMPEMMRLSEQRMILAADKAIAKAFADLQEGKPNGSSGSSPGSSAPTPAPAPSAS